MSDIDEASTMNNHSQAAIAVIIPCYRVANKIESVIEAIPLYVKFIICVDDACPERSGEFIQSNITDHRLKVLFHEKNKGVGGAMVTGYKAALEMRADIAVKIDGDGQMNPSLISFFVDPIASGLADYCKGNRFFLPEYVKDMPLVRLIGNGALSFLTKFSSGYWNIFDPTNGYTAIHTRALKNIPLEKLSNNYFFETDLLFRLNILGAVVCDIPMHGVYQDEKSNLKIANILPTFLIGHIKNFVKRIFYSYFLRDFNIASIELVLGSFLFLFGLMYGLLKWNDSIVTATTASAGTVMLSALPLLIGFQLLLSFLHYDIQSVPRNPLHKFLKDDQHG